MPRHMACWNPYGLDKLADGKRYNLHETGSKPCLGNCNTAGSGPGLSTMHLNWTGLLHNPTPGCLGQAAPCFSPPCVHIRGIPPYPTLSCRSRSGLSSPASFPCASGSKLLCPCPSVFGLGLLPPPPICLDQDWVALPSPMYLDWGCSTLHSLVVRSGSGNITLLWLDGALLCQPDLTCG